MTNIKKYSLRFLPVLFALLVAVFFSALPAYAAEDDPPRRRNRGQCELYGRRTQAGKHAVHRLRRSGHYVRRGRIRRQQCHPGYSGERPVRQRQRLDLNVALSPFTLDEGGGATLKAATITNPKVEAVNGNLGTPPSAKTDVVLDSDGTETPVWNAGTQAGMGVWNLNWNAADTKLTVKPGTAQEGRSVATLTWSLQTTP